MTPGEKPFEGRAEVLDRLLRRVLGYLVHPWELRRLDVVQLPP
jgi:hypothetical protein